VASSDGNAYIWRFSDGFLTVLQGHKVGVYKSLFSKDGKRVLTVSKDGTARLWSLTEKTLTILEHKSVVDATFSPNEQKIVTASYDSTARLWDVSSFSE
jgi:WD40 repeat protein